MSSSAELLRDRRLRVTAARIAALDLLTERSHLTADDVAVGVRERIGSLSVQASYHLLDALVSAGLLRRVDIAGSAVRYERCIDDHHHHLVCRSCGAVTNIACRADRGPCVPLGDRQGYEITEVEVTFWGMCPQCRTSTTTPTNPPGTTTRST
ncbi:Fur family transcriptional regulator [Actinotalea sp. K2]|uniref:Fur family transcriptional regulator n=1 Tax=Actinotalea sp. K2 TaxID=2939438 RepID=UPI002017BA3E|nr:Fur family transcriptional regulator [Actinotalea sp. K2]MCL3860073.1 transcriptional repressor [Actinotalea sp. K2]